MLRYFFLLALLALAHAGDTSSSSEEDVDVKATKLNFGFYVTSRCGDTIRFITQQLYPTYNELKDNLNVEFIPWGKSKRNSDGSISCQFGATDCQANKIQSCVLNLLGTNQAKMVEYMNCEFSTLNSVSLNYQCAVNVGVSEASAKACFSGSQGDNLQAQAEAKTNDITMVFVPTIVKDGRYDVSVQNAAYANFKGYVCGLLGADKPAACP